MKKFFLYLDRYHVNHNSLPNLTDSGLKAFKTEVFDAISPAVTSAMLLLIENERNGESVDHSLLLKCVEVYKAMDKELQAYEKAFEESFKNESKIYYLKKAQEWIGTDSTPQYLIKTEAAINAEVTRVGAYLIPSTEPKIKRIVIDTLLKEQETTLLEREGSGMRALLRDDRRDDLARVYRMFKEVEGDDGLPPIASMVQQHITQEGKMILDKRHASLEEGDGKDALTDPWFITALLDLHEKYRNLIQIQFQGHNHFQKALKVAFETTINTDVGKHTNAELLSTYADSVLKTGGEEKLTESQIDDVLEKVVQLFSFLSDKDVFADVYRNHLAKRLLNQRSVSPFAERTMIQKLKLKCGAFFTSKLEGMLTDLSLAQDVQQKFTQYVNSCSPADRPPIEFSCEVLTTGHWPSYKILNPTLPPVFAKCIDVYTAFYSKNTDHRKLTWVHSLGNATVKGNFKISYDFQVTTLQALAMLVFNGVKEDEALSFGEVQSRLGGLEVEVAKRVLHSLSCQKIHVLNKEPESKKIEETDVFKVNVDFQSKIRKVRIPMASLEETHNPQRVEEDRGLAIEAAIVRIMKARKRLQHNLLVTEVVNQLRTFKPAPKIIKKKIEHLIEREYLARDESEQNFYKYLA
jgi:cullin 1